MLLNLAAGVTAVRDVGNSFADLSLMRQRMASGELLGPRIAAMASSRAEPVLVPGRLRARTLEQALVYHRLVCRAWLPPAQTLQLHPPEWVKPMPRTALGLRVWRPCAGLHDGGPGRGGRLPQLHHINQVTLNFLVGKDDDTRTLLRSRCQATRHMR